MKIFELKNITTEIKQWVDSWVERRGQRKESMNLKATIEMTQSEQQREKRLEEKWTQLQRSGGLKMSNIYVNKVLEEEGNKDKSEKYSKTYGWKLAKFGKRHKSTDSRSWENSKTDKPKEIHIKIKHNQTPEN